MSAEKKTDVLVIGSGPGGYAAAFAAADLGMNVTMVDREERPGGVCLHHGCIPTKALLDVARLIRDAKDGAERGVTFGAPTIDIDKVRSWQRGVVKKLSGGLISLAKSRKVRLVHGTAVLQGASSVRIEPAEGGESEELSFDACIVATGSTPVGIPGLETDHERIMNSDSALDIPDIPDSLLVIGGGYIGLEMAVVYAAFGSRVTVVEMTEGLLPPVDRDMVKILHKQLESSFEAIHLNTKVTGLSPGDDGVEVELEGKDIDKGSQTFDKVLVAVGRNTLVDSVGLDNTRVEVGKDGFVKVDGQRRTAEPSIYAIGDITGAPMLAHKAAQEGRVAAEAIAGRKTVFDPRAIPSVVYTEPEVVWCGLTEKDAKEQGLDVKVTRVPWQTSSRALTMNQPAGVTKLILDPESGRVLGLGAVGVNAGEIIGEAMLGIEMGAVAEDLELTIHPHPTLSETIMEAAELYKGNSTHIMRRSRT